MKEEFFALDIGTRKVMGIVCRRTDCALELVDMEVVEHACRPMFDGQIHSIDDVAGTVSRIRERLEQRLGRRLEKAGVAVAGRNLLTFSSVVRRDFVTSTEITQETLRQIELEAVDKISVESGKDLSDFYCVGYSPVSYELDAARITAPLGHHAKELVAEVIVTFLPRMVLDSIFAVLKKSALEATNVTLEPISAINAIIPAEMRDLNIILVDIGAGTSDLALAREGVIFAYGMVPEAGDEITECISHHLLVDFQTAEKIKRSLESVEEIEYQDIWARRHRVRSRDVNAVIQPAVARLAASIAKAGLELNGRQPQAVVLVGGGSLTHNLIEELAKAFGLSADKVGIRLPSMISGILDRTRRLSGPEAVTPIGIAQMTERSQGLSFIDVQVNGESQVLLDFAQKKDVLGVLTFAGVVGDKRLAPRPGLALTVTVNQELKIIKGTLGEPARIRLNGSPVASLAERVKHGDSIEFIEARDGEDARATIADIVRPQPYGLTYNGRQIELLPHVLMGGVRVGFAAEVEDRAHIQVLALRVRDILESQGVDLDRLIERQLLFNIDAVPKILPQRNFTLAVNGRPAELEAEVADGDSVDFSFGTPAHYRIGDVVDTAGSFETMHINVDDRDIAVTIDRVQVFMNGKPVGPEEFISDGADIRVYRVKDSRILLSEIFKYVEIDPQKIVGKRIRILVDDMPAGFTTPLAEGSRVRLLFEERN
ncbi:MAG: cell division FtsA domain-containing protein [Candidatus Omnitrophica bacterium]|nr:cell division FtsA domain-containing protein [Candidatus Omnitrophota bacterium]